MTRPLRVGIIGAGVVGIATALSLQMEGHSVSVFDARSPGTACSFGNSGGIGMGLVAPIAMPGIGRQAPRLLVDPDEPLFIGKGPIFRRLAWFWRFWRSSRPAEVARIAAVRAGLHHLIPPTLDKLLDLSDTAHLVERKGMMFLFDASSPPAGAKARFELANEHGIPSRCVERQELDRLYADLDGSVGCGVWIEANRHCTNPGRLVEIWSRHFVDGGGKIVPEAVCAILPGPSPTLALKHEQAAFDTVIVCAGVWSRAFAEQLGYRILLESERGYHLMLPHSNLELPMATTLADRNVVITPMEGGLRITGIAEFADVDAQPRYELAHRLLKQAHRYFPQLDGSGATCWVGSRPSTPDSLPIICEAPHHEGIVFAFGHGHNGLALASVTGSLVADVIARRNPPVDLAPLSIARFA